MSEEIPDPQQLIENAEREAREYAGEDEYVSSHYPYYAGALRGHLRSQILQRREQRRRLRNHANDLIHEAHECAGSGYAPGLAWAIGGIHALMEASRDQEWREELREEMNGLYDRYKEMTGEAL